MTLRTLCWQHVQGALVPAPYDPYDEDAPDPIADLFKKGYSTALSSDHTGTGNSAGVHLWINPDAEWQFYLTISGTEHLIGALVARDFGDLCAAMNLASGLLQLVRIEQGADLHGKNAEQMTRHVRQLDMSIVTSGN